MYRSVTMYITTLPVPGKHMVCAPKVQIHTKLYTQCTAGVPVPSSVDVFLSLCSSTTTPRGKYGGFWGWSQEEVHLTFNASVSFISMELSETHSCVCLFVCLLCSGLSLTGTHLMCGDFLYSGHTVMLTLSYLFIKECEFTHSLLLDQF